MADDQSNSKNKKPSLPKLNVYPNQPSPAYGGKHGLPRTSQSPRPSRPPSPSRPLATYPQCPPSPSRPFATYPQCPPSPSKLPYNSLYRAPANPLPQNNNLYRTVPQRGSGEQLQFPPRPFYNQSSQNSRNSSTVDFGNDSATSSNSQDRGVENIEGFGYEAGFAPSKESSANFNNYSFGYNHINTSRTYQPSHTSWSSNNGKVPVSKDEIEEIFTDLTNKFGFQKENMKNMLDHLMVMLDSRASRMTPSQALLSLHADYIGGVNANYRKWYFTAKMDVDDGLPETENYILEWNRRMSAMSQHDRTRQLALWLLLWGEAAQVRFMSECLCFIFKLANDYYNSPECKENTQPVPEGEYLKNVITPLYRYIRDQGYEVQSGKFVKKEKDHVDTIGYDDINELFWYPEMINRIVLQNGTSIISLPRSQRYLSLDQVNWDRVFVKTYKEKRTWLHLIVNFTRIWIIHVSVFWYYVAYSAPLIYTSEDVEEPAVHMSVVAFGGAISAFFMIFANICEFFFIPLTKENTKMLLRRFAFLFIILIMNAAPTYYIVMMSRRGSTSLIIAIIQLIISCFTTIVFSIAPSARLFGGPSKGSSKYKALNTFTANYASLSIKDRVISIGLWCCIFASKFVESYFFLILYLKDSVETMFKMRIPDCNDRFFGNSLCSLMPLLITIFVCFLDLVLFFLDTYLWYVVWNTIFSMAYALTLRSSVFSSWKNIISMIPERIYTKILATNNMEVQYQPIVLVPRIWNAIIHSMYNKNLLSYENVRKLTYTQVLGPNGDVISNPPTLFVDCNDKQCYPSMSEADRRITFFAQSLSNSIPNPLPVQNMPTFTVLTPHFSETILLKLREIIRGEDQNTRYTLLEYLKKLYPDEWENFITDTKILSDEENKMSEGYNSEKEDEEDNMSEEKNADDLVVDMVGFKSSSPEYTLRTRIWASLRSQTLYRTISGFMNYSEAIKLLYSVENPDIFNSYADHPEEFENEMELMARRKFKFIVSMQRYNEFTKEEQEEADFLLNVYPDLLIAYIDEVPPEQEGDEPTVFSVLIDGHCELLPDGKRKPKFRIQLPGNPILGDGKSDNQNHAIIFYRGEYLQLIDANQDHYLEECIKIRNVLSEFEQYDMPRKPYSSTAEQLTESPIAIVGAREYIFSENCGALGDVAARKEQTFGTLTQRIVAKVGGRLHYGHPDFLNGIFMTTRGGISKAQKGLHLNEDIYAGMNAFIRGGRIKHSEYIQCGKGRDLGFGSILNFTTKIGTGMGEQMLSREYYYIGTQLDLDRFLTFYYAHPGFHINNTFIMLSIQLFVLCMVFVGAMKAGIKEEICDKSLEEQEDPCYDFDPITDWIKRSIISIVIVLFVTFLPLFFQELIEKNFLRSFICLCRHFMSLSPFFEVFTTKIYADSLITNLRFGGARYIATGRGFATTRLKFYELYSTFAGPGIYVGMKLLLMLTFVSITSWLPHLTYLWASVIALCVSPFLFNPHQFALTEFIIDYREFLRWMSRGNSQSHAKSWIGYCRFSRTRITGYKRKRLGHASENIVTDVPRPSLSVIFVSEVLIQLLSATLCIIAFMFVKSREPNAKKTSGVIVVCAIAIGPMLMNAVMLAVLFIVSFFLQPILRFKKFGSSIAVIAHTWAIINLIGAFELLWILEGKLANAVLGMICLAAIQNFVFKVMITLFLTREFKHDETNLAWWTGKWLGRGLGSSIATQPFREYICKIVEMSLFATDFILGHVLLFLLVPFCLIPRIDKIHSTMLFWLKPSKQIRPPIFTPQQQKERNRILWTYGTLFFLMLLLFAALIVGPTKFLNFKLSVPTF
ncbi:7357_t:CDS:2 [Funneliformis geosporum]|uniref:1,3-beta-glucan synthase n=1 Tax=Funneliformis geosporum TaxID=1117311 RepID=A0A9W4SNJ9_9GLOM|nr:7357_t:CDS:2 [Funneliformis geosporum]CAI2175666.1 10241_t:CDS:2 [Funneliformis geosporum]